MYFTFECYFFHFIICVKSLSLFHISFISLLRMLLNFKACVYGDTTSFIALLRHGKSNTKHFFWSAYFSFNTFSRSFSNIIKLWTRKLLSTLKITTFANPPSLKLNTTELPREFCDHLKLIFFIFGFTLTKLTNLFFITKRLPRLVGQSFDW